MNGQGQQLHVWTFGLKSGWFFILTSVEDSHADQRKQKAFALRHTCSGYLYYGTSAGLLSGPAVKLYVFMLLVARTNRSINEQDLARRLGTDEESIRATLLELAARDLVQIRNLGVKSWISKLLRSSVFISTQNRVDTHRNHGISAKIDIREKLLADIAKTFSRD